MLPMLLWRGLLLALFLCILCLSALLLPDSLGEAVALPVLPVTILLVRSEAPRSPA